MNEYLNKEIQNDIENKVENLHTIFRIKYGITETNLRNIKKNDNLNNRVLYLNFPWESYENILSEIPFIIVDENKFLCRKVSATGNQYIGYKYNEHYNFLYYKFLNKTNNDFNYIRYKLPDDYGKVTMINDNDLFYPYVKIKDDKYKLLEYVKKIWNDNEIPYLQYIDNIEEGINNVAKILFVPEGYEYKEWTTTGYYDIGSNDYGLAQKPISSKDFERWNRNIELLESIIDSFFNIWNVVSYINWDEENESEFEWEV